MSIRINSLERL